MQVPSLSKTQTSNMWRPLVFAAFLALSFAKNVVIFYNDGEDAESILEYESRDEGKWTEYLDKDIAKGTGEHENMLRFNLITKNKACQLIPCRKPRAMEIMISPRVSKQITTAEISGALKCTNYTTTFEYDIMGFKCENRYQRKKKLADDCEKICKDNHMNGRNGKGICYWCPNVAIRFYCLETDKMPCEAKRVISEDVEQKQIMLANVMEILEDLDNE